MNAYGVILPLSTRINTLQEKRTKYSYAFKSTHISTTLNNNKKHIRTICLLVRIPRSCNFVTSFCVHYAIHVRSTSITAHTANRQLWLAPVSVAKPGKILLIKCMSYHLNGRMQTRRINLRLITLHFLSARRTCNHQLFINLTATATQG